MKFGLSFFFTLSFLAILSFSQFALADAGSFYCENLDDTSQGPKAVLTFTVMGEELIAQFTGLNWQNPHALFAAYPDGAPNGVPVFNYGPVSWQGDKKGYQDFKSASVTVDETGTAVSKLTFDFGDYSASYGNCIANSDH